MHSAGSVFDHDPQAILRAILEASDDAILIKDLDGTVLTWNRGAERIYGYSAAEMLGKPISLLVPQDRVEELQRVMDLVRAGQPVGPFDTVRVARGGHPIEVLLSASPVHDADGRVSAAVVTARDLSAQRRAQRALRRSEARWRTIIESAVDGIITIDQRGRIESFNPAAARMFGYVPEDVLGRNVSTLMPEPYASEHDHYIRRYQMTGERRIIGIGREVTGRRKDGTTFPVHLSVGELTIDGEKMFTGIVRDLTERASLELRLREESGLVRIGELAAVLAHEVKNPLAAVSGAIQVLAEHMTSEEDRDIAQEVLRRLDGLGALMTDLLTYARPPRPRMGAVDVVELFGALVAFFDADPSWRDLRVAVHGTVPPLEADPELLKIAFQNLLINAAQAMQGRGQIVVRLQQSDQLVHVDVTDAGPGIPPDVREKLFTPFYTTKAKGTGLGLATVRRITEAHRGHVEILQSGRDGTTVRVSLPARPTGPAALA